MRLTPAVAGFALAVMLTLGVACGDEKSDPLPTTAVPRSIEPPSSVEYSADGPPPGIEESDEGAVAPGDVVTNPPSAPRIGTPIETVHGVRDVFGTQRAGGMVHGGDDLLVDPAADVPLAPCQGVVESTGDRRIVIACTGSWSVLLAPVGELSVREGERVGYQETIGSFEAGQEWVHFEVRWNGKFADPAAFLEVELPTPTAVRSGPVAAPPAPTDAAETPTSAPEGPTAVPETTPRATATPTRTPTRVPTATPTATPTPRRNPPTPTPIPILR